MTAEELDLALEDLEVRLERLRALYEQYFLGFEKIEPQVARKDVDRRIYVMRREKIRNTGKRFKLQTLIQRYNTFQQYWQRICREIENGTYKRHVLRAERKLSNDRQLTIATRRRFGGASVPPPAEPTAAVASSPPVAAAERAPSAPPRPDSRTPPVPTKVRESIRPQPVKSITAPPRAPSAKPPAPTASPRAAKYESLDLDMGFLGSWAPPQAPKAPAPVVQPAPPPAPAPAAPPPKPARAAPPPRPVRPADPPPKPARPPDPPKAAPAPAAARAPAGSVTDDRVRELHEKLNRMKRDNREGQVSLENLAKTIRATETQLRSQYKGRTIDFEIVQKDGKTIVKPKVR